MENEADGIFSPPLVNSDDFSKMKEEKKKI